MYLFSSNGVEFRCFAIVRTLVFKSVRFILAFFILMALYLIADKTYAAPVQVSVYPSGGNVCITPGQGIPSYDEYYLQMKQTYDPTIHTSQNQVNSSAYWSQYGYGGQSNGLLNDNVCYPADPTYPPSAYNNTAYFIYFRVTTGRPIDYYTKWFYNSGAITVLNDETYYSPIKNTSGSLSLRAGSSTSADVIKDLPQDWVVEVINTTDSGNNSYIANGYKWFQVIDPSDGVAGWMAGENASGTVTYLPNYPLKQTSLQATSSTYIATSSRPGLIQKAISHYFNDSTTTPSLYSSDNGSNNISDLKDGGYKEKVIWGMAAQESGTSPFDFNNQIVSFDYGHGIMQITLAPSYPFDNRGYADTVKIYPCELDADKYEDCYTDPDTGNYNLRSYKPYAGNGANPTYKQYVNTEQSIYSNIKDGMELLADKFDIYSSISATTTVNGTVYSPIERKILSATESYNGSCGYLDDVADKLDTIGTYFPGATTSDISALVTKMHTAGSQMICASLHSPGDLSIMDSEGNTVGVVNGKGKDEFPFAIYDKDKKFIKILDADIDGEYTYVVRGTAKGTYGLEIILKDGDKNVVFQAEDIAMLPNQLHTYKLDKKALLENDKGVTVEIDRNNDGKVDRTINAGSLLTSEEYNKEATREELEGFKIGDVPSMSKESSKKKTQNQTLNYTRDIPEKDPLPPLTQVYPEVRVVE